MHVKVWTVICAPNYYAITFLDLKRRRIGLYEDMIICIRVLHLYLTTANVHVICNVWCSLLDVFHSVKSIWACNRDNGTYLIGEEGRLRRAHARIQREGGRGPDPLKNHQNLGFLSTITKLRGQHSMFGHHQHSIGTPIICRFAGGPIMARL